MSQICLFNYCAEISAYLNRADSEIVLINLMLLFCLFFSF